MVHRNEYADIFPDINELQVRWHLSILLFMQSVKHFIRDLS